MELDNILNRRSFITKKLNEGITPDFIMERLDAAKDLIGKIDYTNLNVNATREDIESLCEKATNLGVKSVCIRPDKVKLAANELNDSPVLVCTVVSFPHGTDTTQEKLIETKRCIANGADEVDMVLNYPMLKNQTLEEDDYEEMWDWIVEDVKVLVNECHKYTNKNNEPITLKVIVESGLLSDEETKNATQICLEAGADFIKTSTGMVEVGAELNKVQIMKSVIENDGSDMKIKASGGIRTLADMQKFDPMVDRFGMGFGSVDNIFGGGGGGDSY